jgi:sugar phosphate isomerase/epimerase
VGILLDSFHWYTAEENFEDIERIPPELLFHVHINDAPCVPIVQLEDNNRLYPGEGVINLNQFIHALETKNYRGIVALEVLSRNPFTLPAIELAAKAKVCFEKLGIL